MTSLFHSVFADTGFGQFRLRRILRRGLLAHRYDRHLQRLDLAELDTWQLNDLSLTAEDVRRECAKSFWRL